VPRKRRLTFSPFARGLAQSVFDQYHHKLHDYLLRRIRADQDTARDLAQEVYLRFLRLEEAEAVRNPQAMMYRIASHIVHEHLLSAEENPVSFDSDAADLQAERPHEWMHGEDELHEQVNLRKRLEELLEELPPLHRLIFLLHKREGYSRDEIAEKLRISAHTVKKYLTQANARLRAAKW